MIDTRAIAAGLFLPALYWTGAVVVVSLFGYPGVVCMTPAAWLLGLPLGTRVGHQSASPARRAALEAAIGGALLGFWQGVLFAGALIASPYLPGSYPRSLPYGPLAAAAAALVGMPATAALAALAAWLVRRRATG